MIFVNLQIAKSVKKYYLLSTLILPYVRVRSYSLAKKIKERSKANTIKPTEKNSLRKTIKKASGNSDRYDLN